MNILEYAILKKMFSKSENPSDNPSDNELIGKWVFNNAPLDMSYLTKFTTHFEGVIDSYLVGDDEGEIYSRIYGLSCSNSLNLMADVGANMGHSIINSVGELAHDFNGEFNILAVISCTNEFKKWLKANATKVE